MNDLSRQSTTVECETLFGKLITLPREKLTFRPSVYAIILRGDKILLLNTRSTGKYSLPGGGVDLGENMEEALHREVREETGLKIAIDDGEVESPQWIDATSICAGDLQSHGELIVKIVTTAVG
jgi:8-oxo-dGTP pyrophosphatase MutT (NUDIX family)